MSTSTAYTIGAIIGAVLIGTVCGLLPLIVGLVKGKMGLAIGGFCVCIVGGVLMGIILALPAALIFLVIILVTSSKDKNNRPDNQM